VFFKTYQNLPDLPRHASTFLICNNLCDLVYQRQACYRYFPKVSPIFDIDAGFKSIVDTDIDTFTDIDTLP